MARKSKVRVDRIIILVLAGILVLMALGLGVYKLFGLFFDDDNKKNNQIDNTPVVETVSGVTITKGDYTVYTDDDDKIGFNFIIAELTFSADEPVSFEFKNLQTSEKINLSDINKQIKALELEGYDLKKLNINTTGIASEEKSVKANVLIPFTTNDDSLSVYNSINASKIEFDLTENNVSAKSLKLADDDAEVEVGSNKLSISKSYISSSMVHNGERYPIASTVKVYTFEVTVLDIQESAYIEDAIYIEDGTSNEIHCYSSEYSAVDCDNIVDKKLSSGLTGGLFFDVISSDNNMHPGTLLVKFSNDTKWVEIKND